MCRGHQMGAVSAEEKVAVIDAIDAWIIGTRQATDSMNTKLLVNSMNTKLLVKDMFDKVGRGDEVADPEWANPTDVGLMMFRLSLKRSGYALVREVPDVTGWLAQP